jgi:hypothetical protein
MKLAFALSRMWVGWLLMPLATAAAAPRLAPEIDLEHTWQRYLAIQTNREPALSYPYEGCFREAAQRFGLPLTLLLAVARGESDFNPRARSKRDAYGLMQIRWPGTAQHLGIRHLNELYDPCTNVQAGARYLRELLDRYQDNLHLALAAYNYGPGRIKIGTNSIPQGAQWYSGYIYRHLQYIQGSAAHTPEERLPYVREGKLELLVFHRPYRAEAFTRYLQEQAPTLRLDWFQAGLSRFRVVLLYQDRAELTRGKQMLQNLGIRVSP